MSIVKIVTNFFRWQSISQIHFRRKPPNENKNEAIERREAPTFSVFPRTSGNSLENRSGTVTYAEQWHGGWWFAHKGHLLHRKGANLQLRPPKTPNSLLRGAKAPLNLGSERKRLAPFSGLQASQANSKGPGLVLPPFHSSLLVLSTLSPPPPRPCYCITSTQWITHSSSSLGFKPPVILQETSLPSSLQVP